MSIKLPYVFISYQTRDKLIAAEVQDMLAEHGVTSFLAHEDIEVSIPWQDKILEELGRAEIFICLLSRHYAQSPWCLQESGIACFRNMHIIPLSLDGSIPEGFISSVQSKRIDPKFGIQLDDFIDGLKAYDPALAVVMLTTRLRDATTLPSVEKYLRLLMELLNDVNESYGQRVLDVCFENPHIFNQDGFAAIYLPQLLKRLKHTLDPARAALMQDRVAQSRR
ncbi:MAG: toll/interleukin-1 receptor domain-containing protein [Planctomycetota bacterium]|nr:toll/interleukin-1 receptor domain-containing protein [Planctomycetota bacterium]